MDHNYPIALLSGLVGFVLGGVLAEEYLEVAAVLLASAAIGTTLGGARAAFTHQDIREFGAAGGGIGMGVGCLVALIDIVFF